MSSSMKTTLQSIIFAGKQSQVLLQRLITQDLNRSEQPQISCICSPAGKVLYIFWVKKHPSHVEVWIDKSHVTGFCQLMRHYDPFKEVQWQINSQQIMSQFINIPTQSIPWELYLIQQHIPTLAAKDQNRFTPQMLKLDQHHAISFNKGCYVGHEVISKIHFKGETKRLIHYSQESSIINSAISHYYQAPIYHTLSLIKVSDNTPHNQ